jgi:Methylase involved in ubiquinone/menaquinone biosynthesis
MHDEIFADLAALDLGETVAEIGAGHGATTRWLLARGHRVCAVDIDPSAVSYLKTALRHFLYVGLLKVVHAPAEALPLTDGECDSAVSVAALHHIRQVEQALSEMERVARRVVVIYDWTPQSAGFTNPHSSQELEAKMQEALATAQRRGYQVSIHRLWYRLLKNRPV